MNSYWTEATLHPFFFFVKMMCMSIKYDHQAFEEGLFVHLSILHFENCRALIIN